MKRAFSKVFTGPPSPTSILVVAGFVLVVTLAGGGLVHLETQQFIAVSNSLARSQEAQHASSILLRSQASVLCLTFLSGATLFGLLLCNLLAHKEAQSLHAANLTALRHQGKELRTFQASVDEHRLTAILQTISQSVANDLVAHSRAANDAPPATNSPQKLIPVSEQRTQNKKILLVDDDPQICTLLAARLKHYEYLVVTAADVSSALTMASAEIPDLVILDMCLPDGDGFLFLERMKEIPAMDRTPIIMLSGNDLDENKQYTLETLSITFFQKGQPNRDFLKTIRHTLEKPKSLPSAFLSA